MPPIATVMGTATAKVADLALTAPASLYTGLPKVYINMKRETLITTATSILKNIGDEQTNHLTKRVKSVKQLIKEKIVREIKKAIKNWIRENMWIFAGESGLPCLCTRRSTVLEAKSSELELTSWTAVIIILWTIIILGTISLCGHCIKCCFCCIERAPKRGQRGGACYGCVKSCYGDHFAEKLGKNREQLRLAGIHYVDTTYLGRCCGRRPLPETAAEIKAMPLCGGGGRKKPPPEVEQPLDDDIERGLGVGVYR